MNSIPSDPLILFDFADQRGKPRRLIFTNPKEVIAAHSIDEVGPCLDAVQRRVDRGLYAAGFVSYEAAPAFDSALFVHAKPSMPLMWFGLFQGPSEDELNHYDQEFQVSKWQPSVERAAYDRSLAQIREAIARGDTYQVNYSLRLNAHFEGDDFTFYRRLARAQRAHYSAYLNIGRYRILSVSPELFFHKRGSQITTRPMKGTRPRGRWTEEDDRLDHELRTSEKERAENVMIVDLLRNDLGRIAETGSVRVISLFDIERYPTIMQMTSAVEARLRAEIKLEDIFRALFPCGSVTGAPKVSTMKMISELEEASRGIYCGAIGFVTPDDEALFNVAIRSVVIDKEAGTAEYGVGGGITWDSTASGEYAEVINKAAILTEQQPEFELLETMRLEDGYYALFKGHLERLVSSARYFDIPLSVSEVRTALEAHRQEWPDIARRVRLLASQSGTVSIESSALPTLAASLPVALAKEPVSRNDRFLYHKTTHRMVHDTHRRRFPDAYDVLLWNEEKELTEFTTGNLVIELVGQRWTPPRECGLLAGTLRDDLLKRGEISERLITRADLDAASRIWLINSVHGWRAVSFDQE